MDMHQIQSLMIVTISLLIFLLMFYLVRHLLAYQRRKSEQDHKDVSQVGFVVDTFHDLLAKLKEKERELEELRNLAEERASSIEVYNENIFQSVPSGVVSFDRSLRITRMNAAALKMLGMNEDQAAGRAHHEIFQSPIREMIEAEKMQERIETAYTTVDGRRLWIGLTFSPLRDSSGDTIGQLLVFTDLTELKAFQSQKELRERLSTLGEMSAGIAHEMRNPLGVISGYTKILSRKVGEPLKPAVAAISREIEVMDRIIADFLTFARPADPVAGEVGLAELIRECADAVGEAGLRIAVSCDAATLPNIRADDVLMRQALTNLIRNAAEAMPEGGDVKISGSIDGENLVIRVADSGHGIADSIRDKIFLPFYTTKERGTGLGLAIVHKIIVSHGGTVRVEPSSRGTVFVITLPAALVVRA